MNTSNADLATNKLQALKSQVKYIDTIPFSELESWEVKEYQQIRANISNEIFGTRSPHFTIPTSF